MRNSTDKENTLELSLLERPTLSQQQKLKPKLSPNTRQLKIQPKLINTTPNTMYSHYKEVPLLSLSGEWLRKAGFDCGKEVVVLLEEGQLVIRLA